MTGREPIKFRDQPWTQEETRLLHEMVQEYARMQWLKKKIWVWMVWVLGLPAGVLMVWEPLVRLWRLLRALLSGSA